MQRVNCQDCGTPTPLAGMFRVNGKTLCESCANKSVAYLKANSQEIQAAREVDATICTSCKTDYGSGTLPLIGGRPFCGNCSQALYNRGYPKWLQVSFAVLLAVLAISLWRGIPYFKAARHLVLAERAMDRKDYRRATTHFSEVFKVSPGDQRLILLAAKAYLLNGDVSGAGSALKLRTEYETDPLFREVNGMWEKAVSAYDKAEKATKLQESKQWDESAALMKEASAQYPESEYLAADAEYYAASAAFEHKDYDAFLAHSEVVFAKSAEDPGAAAAMASALAAKYAVTGDIAFRTRAEEMLIKAKALTKSPEDITRYEEYSERIRYRLESRKIIDKDEYDRRFRQKKGTP